MAPTGYTQDDPLGLSIEGNDKKFPDDLREIFPENSGDLSRENFSPCWFLLENHHATSFDDLRAGYSYLKRKVEGQKEGQLSFLKTHVGAVIEQVDTLMNLKAKMDSEGEVDLAKRTLNLQETISSEFLKMSQNLMILGDHNCLAQVAKMAKLYLVGQSSIHLGKVWRNPN